MPAAPARLPFRNDTLLGVCEAIGQDFGFHANWLRVAFAGTFYFSPTIVIGAYLALGALVLVSRFVFPDRLAGSSTVALANASAGHPDNCEAELALAA